MTDIQRHLKGISKILYRALERADNAEALDLPALRHDLRAFLPKSYGIGSGVLVGSDGESQPAQLLLYDVPLAGGEYPADAASYRIEHTLLVLDVALHHSAETLSSTLERIASLKRLQTFREREGCPRLTQPPGQVRLTIPKDRLPFALVYFDQFEDFPAGDERLFARLHDFLSQYSPEQRPDQIDVIGQRARLLNPLIEHEQTRWYDMGWSHAPDLRKPEACYVCKRKYFRQHFFYEQLCIRCGDLNYRKRVQTVDLSGYRVLVTGARVKIGYAVALRLLRAGADVLVTSRFPRDTVRRYAQEPDFAQWCNRLRVYGLDLRQIPRVEAFAHYLEDTYSHLDAIINNAAQTVKRPPAYYAHLIPLETAALPELPTQIRALLGSDSEQTTQLQPSIAGQLAAGDDETFPAGRYDEHEQQVDNRDFNSWVMQLEDVPAAELVEVHLVNAVAPAILAGQLKRLLTRSPHQARFIINVSAAEGRFAQFKSGEHPHTNMAKAALNMLTRTIAEGYAEAGIYVTSVDPGWVSDQLPRAEDVSRTQAAALIPIDMTDAAARVCDPIFSGVQTGERIYGRLLKDFEIAAW